MKPHIKFWRTIGLAFAIVIVINLIIIYWEESKIIFALVVFVAFIRNEFESLTNKYNWMLSLNKVENILCSKYRKVSILYWILILPLKTFNNWIDTKFE